MENNYKQYKDILVKESASNPAVLLIPSVSHNTMVNQYMKSLKTATMLNNDDALCTKLL